jgi:hypothetical protein
MKYLSGSFLRRRLLSGSAWASGGRIGGAMLGIVTNGLLARLLSPQELGAYFLALSIVSLGAVLGSMGLPKTVVRLVAENMGLDRSGRTLRAIRTVLGLRLDQAKQLLADAGMEGGFEVELRTWDGFEIPQLAQLVQDAAKAAGIRTDRVLLGVYAAAGLIYAVGAWILIGRIASASPQAGMMDNLDSITAVVLGGTSLFGGRGMIVGTIMGALIVGVCRNGLSLAGVDVLWQNFAVGVLVILAVSLDQWIRKARR